MSVSGLMRKSLICGVQTMLNTMPQIATDPAITNAAADGSPLSKWCRKKTSETIRTALKIILKMTFDGSSLSFTPCQQNQPMKTAPMAEKINHKVCRKRCMALRKFVRFISRSKQNSAVTKWLGQRKCIWQMADFTHFAVGQQNFHDVKTDFNLRIVQLAQIIQRALRKPPAFSGVDGLRGSRPIFGRPRFHFRENKTIAVAQNQINFTAH